VRIKNHPREPPAVVGTLVAVHKFPDRRGFMQLRISLLPRLNDVAHEPFLAPHVLRLTRQEYLDGKGATVDLPPLHREIDLRSPGIALYEIEFCSERFLKKLR